MVALLVAAAGALPESVVSLAEHLDPRSRLEPRLDLGWRVAAPAEEGPAHLGSGVGPERLAVRGEGVDVEDEQPAATEIARHPGDRRVHVVLGEEVVDGVVEARDQVELADHGQLAHVGDEDLGQAADLLARHVHHRRREVAGRHLVAARQHRQEALAGPACHVEQLPAAEPVLDRQPLQRVEPALVGVARREAVVEGGEPLVRGESRVVSEDERHPRP